MYKDTGFSSLSLSFLSLDAPFFCEDVLYGCFAWDGRLP